MSPERNDIDNRLFEYLHGMYRGEKSKDFFDLYKCDLESATALSVNNAIDKLLLKYKDFDKVEKTENRFGKMILDLPEYGTSFGIRVQNTKGDNMSENLQNNENRKKELREIIGNLKNDQDIKKMKTRFSAILKDLSPEEVTEAEQALIAEGIPVEEVQKLCEVHVAAFEDALTKNSRKEKSVRTLAGHPVDTYKKENRALKKLLRQFKSALGKRDSLKSQEILAQIGKVEKHYARKENQLFPYLEKVGFTGPSKVMWGKHDEIRILLKEIDESLNSENTAEYRKKGKTLISSMKRMIFMEEKILFPTALRKLPESTWKDIRKGESEIGYSWIKPGNLWDPDVIPGTPDYKKEVSPAGESEEINLSVGSLLPNQIDLMLKNLPLDITYVDENDKVRYYSQGKERIFPRSPGIIGRDVQNCHPPKSVHIVQKIVEDFKSGKRNEAEFWIQMNELFIHIRYFPLFENDIYRGVIEVSQNIAPLRDLKGEKRLLDE